MNKWVEPQFIITLLLIALFWAAFLNAPDDEAIKGAIIAAFAAGYGYWLGSKGNEKATENTGKAFEAITAAANSTPVTDQPQPVVIEQPADSPVPVSDTASDDSIPDYAR